MLSVFNKTDLVRWLLTAMLIAGSYTETGVFTALCLFLIFVEIEGMDLFMRVSLKESKERDRAEKYRHWVLQLLHSETMSEDERLHLQIKTEMIEMGEWEDR